LFDDFQLVGRRQDERADDREERGADPSEEDQNGAGFTTGSRHDSARVDDGVDSDGLHDSLIHATEYVSPE
jgi:hypothetical protein